MKANVLYAVGQLVYEEVATPQLKADEVLIKVKAAGICGSDIARVFKTGTYHFPTIIGHEFAGKVVKVGNDRYEHLLNQKVGVFPLIPCRECDQCQRGNFELCDHYNYLGSRCDGGFAEYVAVPVHNVIPIPEFVSYEEAAMLEPAAVAMHALKRSGLQMNDSLALWGPGTIGMILAQLAVCAGASDVYILGRDQQKLDFISAMGFPYLCHIGRTNPVEWLLQHTNNCGVNVNIEGTGAGEILNYCLETTAPSGCIVTMGNPAGDMHLDKQSYWRLLRKQLTVKGTWNSGFGTYDSDWNAIINLLVAGKLNLKTLISHRLPLKNLYKGLELMKDRSVYTNKVMLINGDENE